MSPLVSWTRRTKFVSGSHSSNPDWIFCCFSTVPPGKYPDSTSDWAVVPSFPILSNSLFSMHLITVRCRAFAIKGINILAKLSKKSSLTLYRETNFSFDRRMYVEWCSRKQKKWNSVATSRGVAIERNKKKHRQSKVPIMFGWRGS